MRALRVSQSHARLRGSGVFSTKYIFQGVTNCRLISECVGKAADLRTLVGTNQRTVQEEGLRGLGQLKADAHNPGMEHTEIQRGGPVWPLDGMYSAPRWRGRTERKSPTFGRDQTWGTQEPEHLVRVTQSVRYAKNDVGGDHPGCLRRALGRAPRLAGAKPEGTPNPGRRCPDNAKSAVPSRERTRECSVAGRMAQRRFFGGSER